MNTIARVEPLTTARSLRGPFDYLLPEHFRPVDVGSLLVVPFGHRRVLGVVVEVAAESEVPPEKLVAPIEALELGVPAELVRLARWLADDYCSTFARALTLVLPPGAGNTSATLRARAKRVKVAAITEAGGTALAGGERLGDTQRAALAALAALAGAPAAVLGGAEPAAGTGGEAGRATAAELPVADLPGASATARSLAGRGFVSLRDAEVQRRPAHASVGARADAAPALTAEQEAVLGPITAATRGAPGEKTFLLHGVTGSGKTEVYLRAAAAALAEDTGVIVLVPEIALTPQIVARFVARFGDTVAVMHSKLSVGERHDEWRRLRRGEARICVGPRSAVFAPVADLGLIVVDEDHDGAYKNEGDPRYDARRVAEHRAEQAGAVFLAGSATPRPESVEAFTRLRLDRRVDGQRLPPVEVVDMCGVAGALHPGTTEALSQVRREGGKAIVLLNRRGWSNFLSCRSCGRAWMCPNCDVTLVLHRARNEVNCHHCGHVEAVPHNCPDCGSLSVARHGAGTERLEHDLAEALGDRAFPVFRLDADTGARKGAISRVLEAFDGAGSGVLVGTQMVAKGHDFPAVTLGVVLDADATLRFPDFRAEERTFALVAQLAGRAGRGAAGGRVIVQTMTPEATSIVHASRHDADAFLEEELGRRRALAYPPYAHLMRVVCSSDAEEAPGVAAAAAQAVSERVSIPSASVLGPAPLFRLRGRERSQLVIKAQDRAAAVAVVGEAVSHVAGDRAYREAAFAVDVDPQ